MFLGLSHGRLQAQPAVTSEYSVATIKANAGDDKRFELRPRPGGGLNATGVTLKMLMMQAYEMPQAFRIAGGPSWVRTARWDVQAVAEGAKSRDESLRMLRSLLEDRFKMRVHRETKETPVYSLVIAKNGSKLAPHKVENNQAGPPEFRPGWGSLTAKGVGVARLAAQLSLELGRPVVDNTGLRGEYDFTLEWTGEPGQGGGPEASGFPPGFYETQPPVNPDAPSLFTAVQEQLGLRLESTRAPVEILMIDSVERPSGN